MPTGHSNTVLVSDLLSKDGPFKRVAEDFLSERCTQCGVGLSHDPRYGEWGAYCPNCWAQARTA
ncbi:MAG: hypothetical protein ABFR95_08115 [Actinomycetota bacterium]